MTLAPHSRTQKGVNQAVFEMIQPVLSQPRSLQILDLPCGQGEFIRFLKSQFPQHHYHGSDYEGLKENADFHFFQMNASQMSPLQIPGNLDLVFSISGVMAFDGVSNFFASLQKNMNPGGHFILTNDNVLTIRDRLSFLFFGRLKRFQMIYQTWEGNWNVMLTQSLWMLGQRFDFKLKEVKYTSMYTEDLLFAPVAALLYPFMLFKALKSKSDMSREDRLKLFSFKALLYRHYILVFEKK